MVLTWWYLRQGEGGWRLSAGLFVCESLVSVACQESVTVVDAKSKEVQGANLRGSAGRHAQTTATPLFCAFLPDKYQFYDTLQKYRKVLLRREPRPQRNLPPRALRVHRFPSVRLDARRDVRQRLQPWPDSSLQELRQLARVEFVIRPNLERPEVDVGELGEGESDLPVEGEDEAFQAWKGRG